MEKDKEREQRLKREFIEKLNIALSSDPFTSVEKVEYKTIKNEEFVDIGEYKKGKVINVTGMKNGEMYKAIGQAIYGKE